MVRIAFILILMFGSLAQANDRNAIEGLWYTADKEGVVSLEIQPNGELIGKIVDGKNPNRKDSKNPDPAKRNDSLRNKIILQGLQYDGKRWSDGTIYDPNNGKTYKLKATLAQPDLLQLRGYIGISLIGRTSEWTRKSD